MPRGTHVHSKTVDDVKKRRSAIESEDLRIIMQARRYVSDSLDHRFAGLEDRSIADLETLASNHPLLLPACQRVTEKRLHVGGMWQLRWYPEERTVESIR